MSVLKNWPLAKSADLLEDMEIFENQKWVRRAWPVRPSAPLQPFNSLITHHLSRVTFLKFFERFAVFERIPIVRRVNWTNPKRLPQSARQL